MFYLIIKYNKRKLLMKYGWEKKEIFKDEET